MPRARLTPRKISRYGWSPDVPDGRDHLFAASARVLEKLPARVDLRKECPPVYDQGDLGSCFPAGTLIRMASGEERPIEHVRLGEDVVTAEGNVGMVHQTMLRLETEELVKLSLWGYGALRMTREHPVLTRRGYVRAGELQLDDFVALPRYLPPAKKDLDVAQVLSKDERMIKAGIRKFGRLHGRTDVAVRVSALPDTIPLTPRFGRLVGLFLAEGSTDSGKVRWTFGAHERDTLVPETVDLLRDLDVDGYVQERPNNSINVVVYGTAWGRLWERLCGNGAGGKSLSPQLMGDAGFLKAVLDGWLAGDGYAAKKVGRSERTGGNSVSKDLAFAMYDIAQALGLRPVIRACKPKVNKYAARRRPYWEVEIQAQGDNWRCSLEECHAWRRVRSLELEEYAGHVYNLSVEGDESYVAEGIGVHNCTGNAIAAALEFDQIKQGIKRHWTPSRLFIYYNERVIENTIDSDSGAQIRDGMKSVAKQGAPPEKAWPYDIDKFRAEPPRKCYTEGAKHVAIRYQRLARTLNQLKGCLAEGFPFVFGFMVYDNFESEEVAKTGEAAMPRAREKQIGGHAVLAVGYEESKQRFIVRNSWGTGWGKRGYFTLPYPYLMESTLSSDFWTVRSVS
jgi:C1A family cysteine protease